MILTEVANTPEAWSLRAARELTHWAAAGWSAQGQSARFKSVIAAARPRAGERLLDFGCGTGRLADLLPVGIEYVGYDPAAGMIDRAKRSQFPADTFQTWEPTLNFDVTLAVGPFNLAHRWSKLETWATLRRLWDGTGRVLAASLYAGEDQRCLIYTEAEVEAFARAESYYWRVERHLPNDLLLVLSRERL